MKNYPQSTGVAMRELPKGNGVNRTPSVIEV